MGLDSLDLFDMHCHLGFCSDAPRAARELAALGVGAFSNTVTPAEFEAQHVALAGAPNVRVGAGLHPWWVGERGLAEDPALHGEHEVRGAGASTVESLDAASAPEFLCELAARNRFVGEVGLDFSPRHAGAREAQIAAFAAAAKTSAQTGGRVLSVHAVRSASAALDVLEAAGVFSVDAGCACILHWFSGISDELVRARRLGCFFSVNPRMVDSKRGRAYVAAISLDRLTLETDLPSAAGESFDARDIRMRLERVAADIAQIRGQELGEVLEATAYNSRQLLAL